MKRRILFLLLLVFFIPFTKVSAASLNYSTHVAYIGWQDYVSNNELAGTTGLSLQLEAIKINLSNLEYDGGIEYSTHVAYIGWQDYVSNNELAGTTGQSLQLEAIKIRLTGELSKHYDICYQTHVAYVGWQDYVCNNELAGTTGKGLRLEAIRIKLVKKENDDSQQTSEPQSKASISYSSSVQDSGFQDYVANGVSGTTGKSKYIDQIKIKINKENLDGDIQYQTYNTNDDWSEYVSSDIISGKEKTPIEAIKIKLTGELSEKYDIYYRVHVAYIGWMGWTNNDNPSGTTGYYRNVEAIEIKMLPKTNPIDLSREPISFLGNDAKIEYSSHVPYVGWQDYVKEGISGTTGQGLRLEAVKIKLDTELSGNVKYSTYISRRGWSEESINDQMSGTSGLSRPIEAIKISLDGEISKQYDIYYRTHNSYVGWLSWAKNGEISGSLNSNTQVEALEIKLVRKGDSFNEDTSKPYVNGHWDGNYYYDYFGNKVTGFRLIDGVKYYFNQEGTLYGSNVMKVVDVSSWQQNINWDLIKANEDVDGAIIRVGWGTSYDDECGLDSQYDYNIQNLQRLNIPYDVYIYGYAETEHAANKEADFVISNLQRYNVPKDTFIWYDAELDIPFDTYRYVIPIFVNKMKAAGYNNVGVYSSVVRLDTSWGNLNDSTIRSYPIWVAQYYRKNQYDGEYKVWQFQSDGLIEGINGYVDVNMYKK